MTSTLTWLAHSESERRQTQEVMRLLDEPGTVDELGVGRIRDSFANQLFPGTSTLHTRARYHLLIAWIYKELERKSPLERPEEHARRREIRLISRLLAQRELPEGALVDGAPIDDTGVIGEFAGSTLVQLPSQSYWNGQYLWGLRVKPGSRALCHQMLSRLDLRRPARDDDGELLPGAANSWWDPHLPDPPEGLWECATLALSHDEAAYLNERVTTLLSGSALAEILASDTSLEGTGAIWELPDRALAAFSEQNRTLIGHAERFSLLTNGAGLLYNLMLAQEADRPETADSFEDRLAEWTGRIEARLEELSAWRDDLGAFWDVVAVGNHRIPSPAERAFIEGWIDQALAHPSPQIAEQEAARLLIADRERHLKRAHARLGNPGRLEAWGGSSGAEPLEYRWSYAARLIDDIREGLARSPSPPDGQGAGA